MESTYSAQVHETTSQTTGDILGFIAEAVEYRGIDRVRSVLGKHLHRNATDAWIEANTLRDGMRTPPTCEWCGHYGSTHIVCVTQCDTCRTA